MEAIIALIIVALVWWGLIAIFQAAGKAVSAGARAMKGQGTLAENLRVQFQGLGPLEARLEEKVLGEEGTGPIAKEVQIRGLVPVAVPTEVAFVTSVIDITEPTPAPVFCPIDTFQEPVSIVFQHRMEAGVLKPGYGIVSWTRAGLIIPEILQPPVSGTRTLEVVVRAVNVKNMPPIRGGLLASSHSGVLWSKALQFPHVFGEKGYREAFEHQEEARTLSVKVGVAVAMADGHLAHEEGETLRNWIIRSISPFSDARRRSLKKTYNGAMQEAYDAAVRNNLNLDPLLGRLNEIGEKRDKYDAMELCFEIMSADGIAHPAEMALIRKIGDALEFDVDEMAELRDHRILSLDHEAAQAGDVEDLLGLEAEWKRDRKLAHLRTEFNKWNSRLNSLPEGAERENAQRMLDLIADARKRYG